jgi:hypothetical protein
MSVIETNDEGLRYLIHEQPKVFVKFTVEDCDLCSQLQPIFEQFAADPLNAGITFARLGTNGNPVAKQLMDERAAPFFSSYCQGHILQCDTLFTEKEIQNALDFLYEFKTH